MRSNNTPATETKICFNAQKRINRGSPQRETTEMRVSVCSPTKYYLIMRDAMNRYTSSPSQTDPPPLSSASVHNS